MQNQKKMSLTAWLKEIGYTNREFADRVGCSPETITHWRSGKIPRILKFALEIEKLSEGIVDLEQLVLAEGHKKKKDDAKAQEKKKR